MSQFKEKQISVRISARADAWLERRARKTKSKGMIIRELIEAEMDRGREADLLSMFNDAAKDVSASDRAEREELLHAFAGQD